MIGALAGFVLLVAAAAGDAAVTAEPDGYRAPPYEGAVPETLAGARVIDGEEAVRLHAKGVPFIDVLPRPARPASLPQGVLWRNPLQPGIPGALAAPGAGYERLSPAENAQFAEALATATGGDRLREVVIYCRRDCWLSWNAARRAVGMGYRAVIWFPDGAEGWQDAGGALQPLPVAP